jgi:hypothetical protein
MSPVAHVAGAFTTGVWWRISRKFVTAELVTPRPEEPPVISRMSSGPAWPIDVLLSVALGIMFPNVALGVSS